MDENTFLKENIPDLKQRGGAGFWKISGREVRCKEGDLSGKWCRSFFNFRSGRIWSTFTGFLLFLTWKSSFITAVGLPGQKYRTGKLFFNHRWTGG